MSKLSRAFDYAIWAALAAAFLLILQRRASGPSTGEAAAPIDLPLADGPGRFRLSEQRGKAVLVEVIASWCGACRRATPTLVDAFRDHGEKVRFVGVVVDDDPKEAGRIKKAWQIPYDVAIDDGSVSRGYKVELLPTIVLIDERGTVRRVTTGMPSRTELETWIREL